MLDEVLDMLEQTNEILVANQGKSEQETSAALKASGIEFEIALDTGGF